MLRAHDAGVVDGVRQTPLAGVSMRYSFDDADAPTRKETQYYEMLSTRGLWHKGWKVSTEHGPMINKGAFDDDRWQLFHTDVDRSEAHDVAAKHPEKVRELSELWWRKRKRTMSCRSTTMAWRAFTRWNTRWRRRRTVVHLLPRYQRGSGGSAARTLGASFKILAEVEFTKDSQGVIVSQGSRFGGYTMFVKDGQLHFVYNFLGIPPEQKLSCPLPASGKHVVGVDFAKSSVSEKLEVLGTMTLYVDDDTVANADFRTQSGHYSLCGEGVAVGRDSADPVSTEYSSGFAFTGGQISR